MANEVKKKNRARVPPPPGNHLRNVEVEVDGEIIKMSPKQKAFCESYAITLNAKQAALEAGYSKTTAKDIGCDNLAKDYLNKYIQHLLKATTSKKVLSATERKEILTEMILDKGASLKDRQRALEILNKMTGEYTQKFDVGGEFKVNEEVKVEAKVEIKDPFANLTTEQLIALAEMK